MLGAQSEVGSVVDVKEAEKEFTSLENEIKSATIKEDVEKGGEWNLREFFEESVRQDSASGHKLKRMGVIVKDLTVVGMGADAASIPTNIDILKYFWPPNW